MLTKNKGKNMWENSGTDENMKNTLLCEKVDIVKLITNLIPIYIYGISIH